MNTVQLEIEMAGNGFVYFSVKDRPDLGYVTLTGQFCNEFGILGEATITIDEAG